MVLKNDDRNRASVDLEVFGEEGGGGGRGDKLHFWLEFLRI